MNVILVALLWLATPVCPSGGRPPCPEYLDPPEVQAEVQIRWGICPCCYMCEPTPCDSCCPVAECQEQDGSNQRFCGMHRYSLLMAERGVQGDGYDGLALQFADPVNSVFVQTDDYVDYWTDRVSFLAGDSPVGAYPMAPPTGEWSGGIWLGGAVVIRYRGEFGKLEDVDYAE